MALDIIIGTQWGDEGKGRVVDLLASQADYVARFNGGDNAGHTVTVGQETFKLHLIPSGIVHPHTVGIIGNGLVVNPQKLLAEMEMLRKAGLAIHPERLKISYAAHLITPGYLALDKAREKARGGAKIGTTLRGIGPAYNHKANRSGIRFEAMQSIEDFAEVVHSSTQSTNQQLTNIHQTEPLDADAVTTEYLEFARQLGPYVGNTAAILAKALNTGKKVLAEGAQGTLLDIDHGTYPYVTSSNPTAPGALVGLGLGIEHIGRIVGVTKAFQTRVGEGPFPTEIPGPEAVRLRGTGENPWDEFGTTTGRPRRVGWLDIVLLRYAALVNGLTELTVTKMDVLSGLHPLRICTGYRTGSQVYEELPQGPADLSPYVPIYEQLPGWDADISAVKEWSDLPDQAQSYLKRIQTLTGVPVRMASVGPERDQIVHIGEQSSR